jgi:hypothetical protein
VPKCSAMSKRSQSPCRNWAIRGASICRMHGANRHVRRAAAVRRVKQDAIQHVQQARSLALALDRTYEQREQQTADLVRGYVDAVLDGIHGLRPAQRVQAYEALDSEFVRQLGKVPADFVSRLLDEWAG